MTHSVYKFGIVTGFAIASCLTANQEIDAGFSFKKIVKTVASTPKKIGKEVERAPKNLKKNDVTKSLGQIGEEIDSGVRIANTTQKKSFKELERTLNRSFEKIEEETGVTFGSGTRVAIPLGGVGDQDNSSAPKTSEEDSMSPGINRTPASNPLKDARLTVLKNIPESILSSNLNAVHKGLDELYGDISGMKLPANANELERLTAQLKDTVSSCMVARSAVNAAAKRLDKEASIADSDGVIRYQLRTKTASKISKVETAANRKLKEIVKQRNL